MAGMGLSIHGLYSTMRLFEGQNASFPTRPRIPLSSRPAGIFNTTAYKYHSTFMPFVFLPRHRVRLRKQRPTSQDSAISPGGSVAPPIPSVGDTESVVEIEKTKGVVRVSHSVLPIHADMLNDLLIGLRRMNGSNCTASDIIRIALDQLLQRPLPEVADLLNKSDRPKPGRPSKQK